MVRKARRQLILIGGLMMFKGPNSAAFAEDSDTIYLVGCCGQSEQEGDSRGLVI